MVLRNVKTSLLTFYILHKKKKKKIAKKRRLLYDSRNVKCPVSRGYDALSEKCSLTDFVKIMRKL